MPVDTDMAPGDVVVVVRQRPIHGLGPEARDGDGHGPPGSKDPRQLGHGRTVLGDVLEHLRSDDAVEAGVGERKVQGVALDDAGLVLGLHLAHAGARARARRHRSIGTDGVVGPG